jgi:hypothetical protein
MVGTCSSCACPTCTGEIRRDGPELGRLRWVTEAALQESKGDPFWFAARIQNDYERHLPGDLNPVLGSWLGAWSQLVGQGLIPVEHQDERVFEPLSMLLADGQVRPPPPRPSPGPDPNPKDPDPEAELTDCEKCAKAQGVKPEKPTPQTPTTPGSIPWTPPTTHGPGKGAVTGKKPKVNVATGGLELRQPGYYDWPMTGGGGSDTKTCVYQIMKSKFWICVASGSACWYKFSGSELAAGQDAWVADPGVEGDERLKLKPPGQLPPEATKPPSDPKDPESGPGDSPGIALEKGTLDKMWERLELIRGQLSTSAEMFLLATRCTEFWSYLLQISPECKVLHARHWWVVVKFKIKKEGDKYVVEPLPAPSPPSGGGAAPGGGAPSGAAPGGAAPGGAAPTGSPILPPTPMTAGGEGGIPSDREKDCKEPKTGAFGESKLKA